MLPARDRITKLIVYSSKANMLADSGGTVVETGIHAGTGRFERVFFNTLPGFGDCNASMFECEVSLNTDLTGKWIRVVTYAYETDEATTRTAYGVFAGKVDSCRKDIYGDSRRLIAYDEIYYLRSVDISDWWVAYWNDTASYGDKPIADVLSAACTQFEVELDANITLRNTFTVIADAQRQFTMVGCSFIQLLKYIGQVCAVYFYIDANGVLKSAYPSKTTNVLNFGDGHTYLDTKQSELGDDETEEFASLAVYSGETQIHSSGSTAPTYVIRDNPLVNDLTTVQLATLFTDYVSQLQDASGIASGALVFIVSSIPDFNTARCILCNSKKFFTSNVILSGSQLIDMEAESVAQLEAGGTYDLYTSGIASRIENTDVQLLEKTRIIVEAMEQMQQTFQGQLTVLSDNMDAFRTEASAKIEANAQGVTLTMTDVQNISNAVNTINTNKADATDLSALATAVGTNTTFRTDTTNCIHIGTLWYEGSTPIAGVAISQGFTYQEVNGKKTIVRQGFYSTYTAGELAFYIGSTKVAYVSNNRLYITMADVTDKINLGRYIIDDESGKGFTIKWGGN